MISAILNSFRIPELKKRLLFTAALVAVYRLGAFIPTPGISASALAEFFSRQSRGTLLGFLDMFSGGAFKNFSIFSLGIMPYVSASIIIQLLTVVVPYLEKLQKEGELGRKKITQYTRYGTIAISIIQSIGLSIWMLHMKNPQVVYNPGLFFQFMTVLTMTTGTAFIMWLGEQINDRGIGNGISLIIFAGIVAGLPTGLVNTIKKMYVGEMSIISALFILAVIAVVVAGVIVVLQGQRKIPVQYAKRFVGRKVYGGSSTYLPLRINQAGVIPIIFASSVLVFPSTIANYVGKEGSAVHNFALLFAHGSFIYYLLYAAMIIFFTYFYTAITFNPADVAENLRKYGGFISGIRPGKPTADYIDNVLSKVTFAGAIFLTLVSIIPDLFTTLMRIPFYFGGTSLLIVVGVALDTLRQVESHLIMRHYEGFIKKGRIKGRI